MPRSARVLAPSVPLVLAFAFAQPVLGQPSLVALAPVPPGQAASARAGLRAASPKVAPKSLALANPVLIVEDNLPWSRSTTQNILTAAGIAYDQAGSAQMATIDLAPYRLVIVGSAQSDAFYTAWNASLPRFEAYVTGGGKLWIGTATSTAGLTNPLLPGGVVLTDDVYAQYGIVAAPGHPWVAGVSSPFDGLWVSHGEFGNLYPGSIVVAKSAVTGNPTLVDYSYGAGRVLATSLTLEIGADYGWGEAPILRNSLLDMSVAPPRADVMISTTVTPRYFRPGEVLTYTIVVTNNGPSDAPGCVVVDTFWSELTPVAWTCSGTGGATCTASGTGNISDTVSLPAGATATYAVTAGTSSVRAAEVPNSATVTVAAGIEDPTPSNNSSTASASAAGSIPALGPPGLAMLALLLAAGAVRLVARR